MRQRWLVVACFLFLFMATASVLATWGHSASPSHSEASRTAASSAADTAGTSANTPGLSDSGIRVVCRVVAVGNAALRDATCRYQFGLADVTFAVPAVGAMQFMPAPAHGNLTAAAPGYLVQRREVQTRHDVIETFVLDPLPTGSQPREQPPVRDNTTDSGAGGTSGSQPGGSASSPSGERPADWPPPVPPTPPTPTGWQRVWRKPIPVTGGGNEPHVAVDSGADNAGNNYIGRIYYAPTSLLYRSDDGGSTWTEIGPKPPTAVPTLGSDDSVYIAPDDSVWYSRYLGYAGSTMGCTSTDHGDTWTCDNNAIPGVTDRMWIVGVDSNTGYVESGEGLMDPQWTMTTDGSLIYVNCATSGAVQQEGNLMYDTVHNKVWEITSGLALLRVDGCFGTINPTPIPVPGTLAIPWLSIYNGIFWTAGNPVDPPTLTDPVGGSGHVRVARSMNEGATWQQWNIPTDALSSTFSYVGDNSAHGLGSHVVGDPNPASTTPGVGDYAAVVYYGSDTLGAPANANGGQWSVHVAHAEDADSANPTWIDEIVAKDVHTGNICIGLNCEQAPNPDPTARYSGDLIGMWVDNTGLAHVAYVQNSGGGAVCMYARQDWVFIP